MKLILLFIYLLVQFSFTYATEFEFSYDESIKEEVIKFPNLESDIINLLNKSLNFYDVNFPEEYSRIPQKISIRIVPSFSFESIMEVHFENNLISISWKRIKKWLYVSKEEKDPKVIQFNEPFLAAIFTHELSHVIHNDAYKKNLGIYCYKFRADKANKDAREFIASVIEILYLVHDKGLPWVYQHHAALFLINNGIPPLSDKYLGKYAIAGIYRRWSAFSLIMNISGCWKTSNQTVILPWNEAELHHCLSQGSSQLIEQIKPWVQDSLGRAQFHEIGKLHPELVTDDINQLFQFSDNILLQILDLSQLKIQSLIYTQSPIFKIEEVLDERLFTGDKLTLSNWVDEWYLFRYHHLKGMFNLDNAQKYIIR